MAKYEVCKRLKALSRHVGLERDLKKNERIVKLAYFTKDRGHKSPNYIYLKKFIAQRSWKQVVSLKIRMSALEPIGYRVAKLQAKDADTGVNADIRYALTEESSVSGTEKLFHLSEDSGELFIAAKLSTPTKEASQYLRQATYTTFTPLMPCHLICPHPHRCSSHFLPWGFCVYNL